MRLRCWTSARDAVRRALSRRFTGNLDDTQLAIGRTAAICGNWKNGGVILAFIEEQGKLTDELRAAVDAAATKQALEDIYLPYKPKRRTRAQTAREAEGEPLADAPRGSQAGSPGGSGSTS